MATTKLVGVRSVLRANVRLKNLYKKILRMSDKLPRKATYRINTEAIVCHRLGILEQTEDLCEIEESINCGNMEMLISQAQAEYELCQRMIVWKCWEPLKDHPPPGQWFWPPIIK